jgi:hypothetical protein
VEGNVLGRYFHWVSGWPSAGLKPNKKTFTQNISALSEQTSPELQDLVTSGDTEANFMEPKP